MLSCDAHTMAGYLILPDGREVEVRDGLLLGRIPACDILIDDTKASRRHAKVRVEGSVAEIEDLESSNGTLLNGKRVQRRTLRPGDVIQIGAVRIEYREGAPAPATAAKPAPPPPPSSGDELVFDDEPSAEESPADESGAEEPARRPGFSMPAIASPPPRPAPPPPPSSPSATTLPPPAPSAGDSLEFLDEVVKVRTAPPPKPGVGGKAAAPPARDRGVLQYHKRAGQGGVLGDDMAQMSAGKRWLLVLFALVAALVMGYLAMQLAG